MSITIISRDSELGLTQKKLEGYKKYAEIIQYGRKNPVKFAETFLSELPLWTTRNMRSNRVGTNNLLCGL